MIVRLTQKSDFHNHKPNHPPNNLQKKEYLTMPQQYYLVDSDWVPIMKIPDHGAKKTHAV